MFGCLCYPCLRPYTKHRLEYRSSPCTFLGYSCHHKGYKCLEAKGRIYITKHVVFHESLFPFAKIAATSCSTTQNTQTHPPSLFPPVLQTQESMIQPFNQSHPSPLHATNQSAVSSSSHIPFSNAVSDSPHLEPYTHLTSKPKT